MKILYYDEIRKILKRTVHGIIQIKSYIHN